MCTNQAFDYNSLCSLLNDQLSIGLIDLDNKMKAAEFAAITYFNKSCPYCGVGIFDGHIRNTLNIDHFWPISKGGQHVPWNILPICGKCNRTKKDKLPHVFLNEKTFYECLKYLLNVKKNFCNESQMCCEIVSKIRLSIFTRNVSSEKETKNILRKIFESYGLVEKEIEGDHTIVWIMAGAWKIHTLNNQIEKAVLYKYYCEYCAENGLVNDSINEFGRKFFKVVDCKSVRINIPSTGNRPWGYRLT